MSSKTAVVFGATSAIAHATSRFLAEEGYKLVLVGRDSERLRACATDLGARFRATTACYVAELGEISAQAALVEKIVAEQGTPDLALVAYGILGDQSRAETDLREAGRILHLNYVSPVNLLQIVANVMRARKQGVIVGISSVAGDRGRASNYFYGSAKAGFTAFLSGLRAKLSHDGVHVVTVKPGFVDTPMTAHVKKGPLFASPEQVARGIVKAVHGRKNVVYLPVFWCLIMTIIRLLPESIFKKLKF